jgi:hypothetical protein
LVGGLLAFSTACSPFKASTAGLTSPPFKDTDDSSQSSSSTTAGEADEDSGTDSDTAAPGGAPGKINLQELSLDFSFAQIHDVTQTRLTEALDKYIRKSDCTNVGPNEYRCGELPFGEIINADKKKILEIPLAAMNGADGGLSYHLDAAKIPIYLNRAQSGSVISISDLTSKQTQFHYGSQGFTDDVFLKLNPQGGKMSLSVCMALPGIKGYSEKTRLSGYIVQDIPLLPDIRSDLLIDVDPGWVELRAAKLCSELSVEVDKANLLVIKLVKVDIPKDICTSYAGLTVDVNAQLSGLWAFVNNILKVFRVDLEKMIAAEVKKQVIQLTQKEATVTTETIESGKWISDLLASGYLENAVTQVSDRLRTEMIKNGWLDLMSAESLQVSCMSAFQHLGLDSLIGPEAFKVCALVPKLEILPFQDDGTSRQMGCYSHYFSITEDIPSGAWWADSCRIKNKILFKTDSRESNLYS